MWTTPLATRSFFWMLAATRIQLATDVNMIIEYVVASGVKLHGYEWELHQSISLGSTTLFLFFSTIYTSQFVPNSTAFSRFAWTFRTNTHTFDVFVVHYIYIVCFYILHCWMPFLSIDRRSNEQAKGVRERIFCLVFDTDTISMLNANETTRKTFYRTFSPSPKISFSLTPLFSSVHDQNVVDRQKLKH